MAFASPVTTVVGKLAATARRDPDLIRRPTRRSSEDALGKCGEER
jgi:hypothetical protein